jgi:hypothetical protein
MEKNGTDMERKEWNLLFPLLTYPSTMEMEVEVSPNTFITIYQIIQCHIPEGGNLQSHHPENFKSTLLLFNASIFFRFMPRNSEKFDFYGLNQ